MIWINEVFFKRLEEQYGDDPHVVVIHESAENMKKYTEKLKIKKIDYVLSSLPFITLPQEVSSRVLNNVVESLQEKDDVITFQYSLVKKGFSQNFFSEILIKKVGFNFPPAYIFSCRKETRRTYA